MYQNQSLQQNVATASKSRAVRSILKQKSRSFSGKKRRTKKCAPVPCGNGFLSHAFAPLVNGYAKEINSYARVEESVFSAAGNLCDLYGIKMLDYSYLVYPQNVAQMIEDLQYQIGGIEKDANVIVISSEFNLPTLAITKAFDIKTTLYYLPVEPLHSLMQQDGRKSTSELLLSVLCYFYQIGGIPYFGENSSYLYYIYQMVYEWNNEEEFVEDFREQQEVLDHIALIESESAKLLRVLSDKGQLELLANRLIQFIPETDLEVNLKAIASRVCTLAKNYPSRSIMDSIAEDLNLSDGEGRITAEHYLSFIWSGQDCLYDQLMETVNCELQEYDEIDEPISIQLFDYPQAKITHDLSFEKEFFDLLNELSDNLHDFAHEKHH